MTTAPWLERRLIREGLDPAIAADLAAGGDVAGALARHIADGVAGGGGSLAPFEYLMPVAQTTATIDHTLGRDPVAVQVLLDGMTVDEYSVQFTVPGSQVRIGFDIAAAALIRLL